MCKIHIVERLSLKILQLCYILMTNEHRLIKALLSFLLISLKLGRFPKSHSVTRTIVFSRSLNIYDKTWQTLSWAFIELSRIFPGIVLKKFDAIEIAMLQSSIKILENLFRFILKWIIHMFWLSLNCFTTNDFLSYQSFERSLTKMFNSLNFQTSECDATGWRQNLANKFWLNSYKNSSVSL